MERKLKGKCPRCHCASLIERLSKWYTGDTNFCYKRKTKVVCWAQECDFKFVHVLDTLVPTEFNIRIFLAEDYGPSDLVNLLAYNNIGYRTLEVWYSLHTIRFSQTLCELIRPMLASILVLHNAQWKCLIYKILDPCEDFIHPDLVRAYIVPMLGFEIGLDAIQKKIDARYRAWDMITYSGIQTLFDEY